MVQSKGIHIYIKLKAKETHAFQAENFRLFLLGLLRRAEI
jgi:hypothetical protein